MDAQQLINELTTSIDDSVNALGDSLPAVEKEILRGLELELKDLDVMKSGTVKATVKNIRLISKIKGKMQQLILRKDFIKKVANFTKTFDQVSNLQNQYFKSVEQKFKPTALLEEIKKQSIDTVIDDLTERGVGANVIKPVFQILKNNITVGGTYGELLQQLRDAIAPKDKAGILQKYTKQITTDALNQYSAQYTQVISEDLGFEWFMYTGSNLSTTREFCDRLTEKKYVHVSELPRILEGKIDGHQVKMNPKTKLWYGAIDGTNVSNFRIYRGGYNCGHQLLPIDESLVPQAAKAKVGQTEQQVEKKVEEAEGGKLNLPPDQLALIDALNKLDKLHSVPTKEQERAIMAIRKWSSGSTNIRLLPEDNPLKQFMVEAVKNVTPFKELYRATSYGKKDPKQMARYEYLRKAFKVGEKITFGDKFKAADEEYDMRLLSFSHDKKEADSFGSTFDPGNLVINYVVSRAGGKGVKGLPIESYSRFSHEQEVIVGDHITYEVKNVITEGRKTTVYLEMTE